MANKYFIHNVTVVNEGNSFPGIVRTDHGKITQVVDLQVDEKPVPDEGETLIDGKGKLLIPGVIDDQVHMREPGLTYKADIYTESRAAVAGGVTSWMEMPNTKPPVLTQELLEDKYKLAAEKSLANYSFYMGASNDNIEQVLKTDPTNVCGIKVFMGASTGNMLVDNRKTLEGIFSSTSIPVAVHCEDEATIRKNKAEYQESFGNRIPVGAHPSIRSTEACYRSSSLAVELATKYNTRLHVLHLSTGKEMELFDNKVPLKKKRITAEVCIHHLWFTDQDYSRLGPRIRWNPAIKAPEDREELWRALLNDKIDVIATDHAPHTLEEKMKLYAGAPSGGPLLQHSLQAMLEFYHQGKIDIEKLVEKMCHAPAILFNVKNRGFLRKGYYADMVLVDLMQSQRVDQGNLLYKCGWSPFENVVFSSSITHTFVNGKLVYENGEFYEHQKGMRLQFDR
ncbi:MAG: dihydroorotase [Bacteroidales bacterium]|nr:dihydroorotase [Bacteroidales bacterium]